MADLYFLIGIPCSGKSFWARQWAEQTGAVVISPDEIRITHRAHSNRAFEIARKEIEENLKAGRDVVFDATNTIRKWRKQNIDAGKTYADRIHAVVFDTNLTWCLKRHKRRVAEGEKTTLHEGVIRRMNEQLSDNMPILDEGFNAIMIYSGILIKMLDGPYAGEDRQVFSDQYTPEEMFGSMVNHGWRWIVDYTVATNEEILLWFPVDMKLRSVLAGKKDFELVYNGKVHKSFSSFKNELDKTGRHINFS